jgi:hypothetical protein
LQSATEALRQANSARYPRLTIYTDSGFLVDAVTQVNRKTPEKNIRKEAMLPIGIWDPVLFWPLDLGKVFSGSRIPRPIFLRTC